MPTYLDIITALPATGNGDKSATRTALVKRGAYCLADSENLSTLTVTDPDYGGIPLYVIQQRRLFQYDSTDTTTASDGVTVLVSADGKRYKIDDYLIPWSVKSKTLTVPPASPANGDAYIVAVAATGAWSGKDNKIATWSVGRNAWQFNTVPEGRFIYNEADGSYYFRDQTGSWIRGVGNLPLATSIVPLSAIIGAKASLTTRVVNQTTNAPPGSPAIGDAYIIGPTPSGAWTGNATKVAVCENGSTFTIYTQADGDRVYDIAQKNFFVWSSTSSAWITGGGNMIMVRHVYTSGINTFTHDARCIMVDVTCIGGGGGAGAGSSSGGTSSFGAHNSATGGAASALSATSHMAGASGVGSGGDRNGSGVPGFAVFDGSATNNSVGSAGVLHTEFGAFWGGTILDVGSNAQIGGPPGISRKVMLVASLLSNETVTVGAAGANANVSTTYLTPTAGMVVVDEWVLA